MLKDTVELTLKRDLMDEQLRASLKVGNRDLLTGVADDSAAAGVTAALKVKALRDDAFRSVHLVVASQPCVSVAEGIGRVILTETLVASSLRGAVLIVGHVGALARARATELADAIEASLLGELSHALRSLEVHLTRCRQQLMVQDVRDELVVGALEASVQVDFVALRKERCRQR